MRHNDSAADALTGAGMDHDGSAHFCSLADLLPVMQTVSTPVSSLQLPSRLVGLQRTQGEAHLIRSNAEFSLL